MQLRHRGAALIAALLFLMVASGIITLMFTSTLSELRHSSDDVAVVQALTLARGGANLGGRLLNENIRNDLSSYSLKYASTVEKFPFGQPAGNDPTAKEPTPSSVISGSYSLERVTSDLQTRVDSLFCGTDKVMTPSSGMQVRLKVFFTNKACSGGLPSGVKLPAARFITDSTRTYAVPFVLVSEAVVGKYKRNVVVQGEYQFTLGGGKFSQYALFTNKHEGPTGGDVWFTSDTLFEGPVHTNTFFRFYQKPYFGGKITSAGCSNNPCNQYNKQGAEFSSYGFISADSMTNPSNPVYGSNAPQLTGGVDWRASYIPLPTNALDQKTAAQASGLYIDGNLYSLSLFAGDAGENRPSLNGSGGWTPKPTYQYIRVCTTSTACDLYRYTSNKELYKKDPVLGWTDVLNPAPPLPKLYPPVTGNFNGVIYVNGKIERLRGPTRITSTATPTPALASFAQMTVVPTDTVRITGDITYEVPPCTGTPKYVSGVVQPATCSNLSAQNVFGIFAPTKDILIGNQNSDATLNAPDDVAIQGVLMTGSGVVTVENFTLGSPRGSVKLLGGIIENNYGPFGQFSSSSGVQIHGYGRSFTYDQRMKYEFSPPYFPGTQPSVVQDVFVYSFGQREQAY